MTEFCEQHIKDRTWDELKARRRELQRRDLSDKPGLQAELVRVQFWEGVHFIAAYSGGPHPALKVVPVEVPEGG